MCWQILKSHIHFWVSNRFLEFGAATGNRFFKSQPYEPGWNHQPYPEYFSIWMRFQSAEEYLWYCPNLRQLWFLGFTDGYIFPIHVCRCLSRLYQLYHCIIIVYPYLITIILYSLSLDAFSMCCLFSNGKLKQIQRARFSQRSVFVVIITPNTVARSLSWRWQVCPCFRWYARYDSVTLFAVFKTEVIDQHQKWTHWDIEP